MPQYSILAPPMHTELRNNTLSFDELFHSVLIFRFTALTVLHMLLMTLRKILSLATAERNDDLWAVGRGEYGKI